MMIEDIESRNSFLATLEWLLAIAARYDRSIELGLIHIEYGHRNELGETYGAHEAVNQLAEMTRHLKQVFRKTDLVCRNGSDFWVIVPYTPSTERLYDKVFEILGGMEHEGLRVVNPEISVFDLTALIPAFVKQHREFNALDFIEHLRANKECFAHRTFCLYPPANSAIAAEVRMGTAVAWG